MLPYWGNSALLIDLIDVQRQMGSISATFTARLCLQSINLVGERWHYGDPMNECFDCRQYHGNDGQIVGKFDFQEVKNDHY